MPDVLWTMYMKMIDRIRLIFKNNSAIETNKIVVLKSCPHCTSRGMFVFNNTTKISTTISKVKLKDRCQSELVED
jgi:hypothetical protein